MKEEITVKPKINFDEFMEIEKSLEIKFGVIIDAEPVPKSNGLKLNVSFGDGVFKQSFTNLGKTFKPDELINKICPFITNLEPTVIKGVVSEVMIMVATDNEGKIQLNNYEIGSKLL